MALPRQWEVHAARLPGPAESSADDNKRVKWCLSVAYFGPGIRSKEVHCEVGGGWEEGRVRWLGGLRGCVKGVVVGGVGLWGTGDVLCGRSRTGVRPGCRGATLRTLARLPSACPPRALSQVECACGAPCLQPASLHEAGGLPASRCPPASLPSPCCSCPQPLAAPLPPLFPHLPCAPTPKYGIAVNPSLHMPSSPSAPAASAARSYSPQPWLPARRGPLIACLILTPPP